MPKKSNLMGKVTQSLFYSGLISTIIYLVVLYSSAVGLYDTFQVEISGNQFVYESTIKEQLYPYLTDSIFSIDVQEIQSKVEEIDYIETVQVSRILPNIILIQVIETEPLLLIHFNDENYFMEKNGSILKADKRAISYFPVPLITIADEDALDWGITKNISQFFSFIMAEYPRFYDNVSEVLVQEGKWIFYCDSKTRIYADPQQLTSQFIALKYFERTVYPNRSLKDYSYIDLTVDDLVVVKEKYRKG